MVNAVARVLGPPDANLFVGIVTHIRSPYWAEVTAPAERERMMEVAQSCGLRATFLVNEGNAFDDSGQSISGRIVCSSAWYQAGIEAAWHRYLTGSGLLGTPMRRLATVAVRMREYLPLVRRNGRRTLQGKQMLRRLANIESSHLSLMQAGVDSGAGWILILEDDAHSKDLAGAMRDISHIMRLAEPKPKFASLSTSFGNAALGVTNLLHPRCVPQVEATVLVADRPVTNTVCAVLYRTDFAAALLREYGDMGLMPLCAIDWKFNAAIMRMYRRGDIGQGDCWFLEPGPFVQRSMA